MAALASLTTNYSDSEEEDDRSETPEMMVEPEILEEADKAQSSEETEKIKSSEQTEKLPSSSEINNILTSDAAKDLGPILGPQPKPEESWSYKGLRDFSKTVSDNPEEEDDDSSIPPTTPEIDSSCYSYEGDICIYTDPATSSQYIWDDSSSSWEPKQSSSDVTKNYVYDGNTYWYKDKSGAKYRWNNASNQWESVMADCPLPEGENSKVMGPENSSGMGPENCSEMEEPQGPSSMVGPTLPVELPRRNEAAAYSALLVDTAPAIRSKVSGDRAARQLNHYMDYEAFERQANIGFEKPKFTKKQIQVLRRRKQEKKYKKSLEWLKKDY